MDSISLIIQQMTPGHLVLVVGIAVLSLSALYFLFAVFSRHPYWGVVVFSGAVLLFQATSAWLGQGGFAPFWAAVGIKGQGGINENELPYDPLIVRRLVKESEFNAIAPRIAGARSLVGGRLHGQEFVQEQAELIDGLLRLKQGDGFYAKNEVLIFLNQNQVNAASTQGLSFRPGDLDSPIIHMSWLEGSRSTPETQIFKGDYWMHLNFYKKAGNQLNGFVQLMLPDTRRSYLTGEFDAYTDQLRYQSGEVDKSHDSADTLEYIAKQHVIAGLNDRIAKVEGFENTTVDIAGGGIRGSTTIDVRMTSGKKEKIQLEFVKSNNIWKVSPTSNIAALIADQTIRSAAPAAGTKKHELIPNNDRRQMVYDHTYMLSHLDDFLGKRLRIGMEGNKQKEGIFVREQRGSIVLKTKIKSGYMEQFVPKELIVAVWLE